MSLFSIVFCPIRFIHAILWITGTVMKWQIFESESFNTFISEQHSKIVLITQQCGVLQLYHWFELQSKLVKLKLLSSTEVG